MWKTAWVKTKDMPLPCLKHSLAPHFSQDGAKPPYRGLQVSPWSGVYLSSLFCCEQACCASAKRNLLVPQTCCVLSCIWPLHKLGFFAWNDLSSFPYPFHTFPPQWCLPSSHLSGIHSAVASSMTPPRLGWVRISRPCSHNSLGFLYLTTCCAVL